MTELKPNRVHLVMPELKALTKAQLQAERHAAGYGPLDQGYPLAQPDKYVMVELRRLQNLRNDIQHVLDTRLEQTENCRFGSCEIIDTCEAMLRHLHAAVENAQ